ncbi:UNVERIFIED_CONTAM: Proteinase inhibitor, partial [Sesamum radiatum]
KDSWPELVGVCGEIAVKTIEKENSLVNAILVPPAVPTFDYRCDRVFVFIDEKGIVTRVPMIF